MTTRRRRSAATLLLVLIFGGCGQRSAPPPATTPPPPTPTPSRVLLFFPGEDTLLHGEVREIPELPSELAPRIRLLVEELALGSTQGRGAVFPWSVAVLGVFVDEGGDAFVDLSAPPPRAVEGSATETALLFGTVSSVVANCPGVRRLQLLFDGHEIETLGHLDFSRPLAPRPELIAR
jgi:hypothetical protein